MKERYTLTKNTLFSGYKALVTRHAFPVESGICPTPYDLCFIENIRKLDLESYWVRVRTIELDPFSKWYTAILTQEQLAQSLLLEEGVYLTSTHIVAPHQPALTAHDHEFLGGFFVDALRPLEQDMFLVDVRSVIYAFTGLPQKTTLLREQIAGILPVPEWWKRRNPAYPKESEKVSRGL